MVQNREIQLSLPSVGFKDKFPLPPVVQQWGLHAGKGGGGVWLEEIVLRETWVCAVVRTEGKFLEML